MTKPIKRIAVTGGGGQIAYQLLFRLASGELFGHDQPIALQILEIPQILPSLEGLKMELEDCAYPLLYSTEITSDPYQAFKDVDFALLIGAKPRGPGMERGDLLHENGKIFFEQGKALNEVAHKDVKVFVVGNPCNTNCLIALNQATRLSPKNFFAMTRLDQNRATALLAQKSHSKIQDVTHMIIWGNHSATQVPDFMHARIHNRPVESVIKDRKWLENEFIELVQKRGAEIIRLRGKSSAASAAQAIIDAVKDTLKPSQINEWYSSAILSSGNPYGIEDNLIFSFPCYTNAELETTIVPDLDVHDFIAAKLKITEKELLGERDLVRSLLK